METITVRILREDVYDEVAKATDYTGSKLMDKDAGARDRILATDSDLADLGRFWDEAVLATNERLKGMIVSGGTKETDGKQGYVGVIEVSKSFDKELKGNVEAALRGFFIFSIIGQWYKLANKGEAADNLAQAGEMMDGAERLLYSRKKPTLPKD